MTHDHRLPKPGGRISRRHFLKYGAALIAGTAAANHGLAALTVEAAAAAKSSGSMINTRRDSLAPAYLACPSGGGTHPAVIVLHTSRGLTGAIKNAADRLAEAGFVALAPDLYRGQKVVDANRWAANADAAKIMADIQQSMDFLMTQRGVKPGQVGLLAFGFGGALAFALAQASRRVGVSVVMQEAEADPVRLMPLPTAFRAADPRGFGPLILNTYGSESLSHGRAAADAWEQALRWFKVNLAA